MSWFEVIRNMSGSDLLKFVLQAWEKHVKQNVSIVKTETKRRH